jgi:beta-galactosidase/beta-glucuronidase
MQKVLPLLLTIFILLWVSCSHKYDPDIHNLDFYQWNLWEDEEGERGASLPSCGWEDLHRGKGRLVRIPAMLEEHFPDAEQGGIYWYHCRFTLPEQWREDSVSLFFEGTSQNIRLFLNEKLIGSFQGNEDFIKMDVSESIFHTRDNHLSIRISNDHGGRPGKLNGVSRTELRKSK